MIKIGAECRLAVRPLGISNNRRGTAVLALAARSAIQGQFATSRGGCVFYPCLFYASDGFSCLPT